MFSRPRRDPRRHTAALVFVARARGVPKARDDAKGVRVVPIAQLQTAPPTFAFDHGDIVGAYVRQHHPPEATGGAGLAVDDALAADGQQQRRGLGNRSARKPHKDSYDWACGAA